MNKQLQSIIKRCLINPMVMKFVLTYQEELLPRHNLTLIDTPPF